MVSQVSSEVFEPTIVAYCCYYCGLTAADLAGAMRLEYPANVRVVEVPCSGKTDPRVILGAFEGGADGVYVVGCLEGDCYFIEGNTRAAKRVARLKALLDQIGVGGERLAMYNVYCSMGPKFAAIASEMTERIRALGPSPLRRGAAATAGGGGGDGSAGTGEGSAQS